MRLVMMGTGPFAAPTFRALFDTPHEVAALVTQPERPAVGKRAPPKSPLRSIAEEHETPILDPVDVNSEASVAALAALRPDLFIVADYGQILRDATLAVAPHGGINLHGSLLPKYRGAAPINWAVFHGEAVTGVTVIQMQSRIDAGACLAQATLAVDADETAVELETRLAELGAPLVCRVIDALAAGHATPIPQDAASATKARRLRKSDGEVDWHRPAEAIRNQVRAFEPWPRTSTAWLRPASAVRVILVGVKVDRQAPQAAPGAVVVADRQRLVVAASDGALEILKIQPAGKRAMTAGEFLRGYPVAVGDRFGTAS